MRIDLKNLHHAYLLIGPALEVEQVLHESFNLLGFNLRGHPDYFHLSFSTLGVNDAREISLRASRKAFSGKKIFLISAEKLTRESQNALLKTFEDPMPDTHFFLVVREKELILPTLLSRMRLVYMAYKSPLGEAERFIKSSLKERLKFASQSAEESLNLAEFLDALLLLSRRNNSGLESLKSIYVLREFANDTSSSRRLVLEHLALVL